MKPKKPAPSSRAATAPDSAPRAVAGARACVAAIENGAATSLEVRAQPGAKRAGFAGFWNGMPKIAVSAPPEKGRANEEIAAEIAEIFGLRASAVSLHSGATSRQKKFRLACTSGAVLRRLDQLEASTKDNEKETRKK